MWTAIIPARKNSRGLPEKNVYLLGGKPLYAYSLDTALTAGASRVCLSTDIDLIAESAFPSNCFVDWRSEDLAGDNVSMDQVIFDLCYRNIVQGVLVLLQPTSPLRSINDISSALNLFEKGNHQLVMTVSLRDSTPLKCGFISDDSFIPISNISYTFKNRQSLPRIYKPNGSVYVFNSDTILRNRGFPCEDIGAVVSHSDINIDIDNINDMKEAERIISSTVRS